MKKYLLTMLVSTLGLSAWAQGLTVSGIVTSKEDGEPLIGATVRVQGTSKGTATDFDGNYTLTDVPSSATLVFNYVGYQEISIPVKGQSYINVQLSETATSLDELVVVGYGVAKKSDLTSSISTIKGSELNEMVSGNAMDAIQGTDTRRAGDVRWRSRHQSLSHDPWRHFSQRHKSSLRS